MWLRDTGVLGKLRDDELSAPIPIPTPKIKVDGRISVEQIGIGIAIYSVGMTLSLLFFIGEFCTENRVKKQHPGRKKSQKEHNDSNGRQDIIMPPNRGHQSIGNKSTGDKNENHDEATIEGIQIWTEVR